ncbi:MAG: energy transducer TonB [Nitrospirae bacterium]|nr:energy transducer TonB [Nitrospirota bacterium]
MSLKKTLALSLLLHLGIFAVVLLSAELLQGSSKLPYEKVFFVKLTEYISSSVKGHTGHIAPAETHTKKPHPERSPELKAEDKPEEKIIPVNLNIAEGRIGLKSNESPAPASFIEAGHYWPADASRKEEKPHNYTYASSLTEGNTSSGKGKVRLSDGSIEIIRNAIEKAKSYPLSARKRGIEGTVYVSFTVNPGGNPDDIKIITSSGFSILDNATLKIVRKAAPFPRIDSPVEVPVVFRLDR